MEKKLEKLLKGLSYKILNGDMNNVSINKLCYDSKKVGKDDLFICLAGARFDSHTKIEEVVDAGAKVIVVESGNANVRTAIIEDTTIVIECEDNRHALAIISKNYFEKPDESLHIIGVTGTKGKTTTSFMIKNILEADGEKVGYIGTIGIIFNGKYIKTNNTTPESYVLYEYFYMMKVSGVKYVVMEVSSQSLKYHRVDGLHFLYAVWTNIMPEHIGPNEHDSFDDYFNSKLKIFSMCSNAVINSSTDYFDKVVEECKKYMVCTHIKNSDKELKLLIPGKHNIDNANLALRLAKSMDVSERIALHAVENTIVPGRCELVYKDSDIIVYVDYSYEASGATKLMETVMPISHKRIVAVYGCGGNRAKDRRYGLGEVTGKYADFVILTADNSRYEKTIDIIHDIETTLTKYKKKDDLNLGYIIIEDRREAIEYAIKNRKKGDIICVMGKGHESESEENGIKTRFLDKEEVLKAVEKYIRGTSSN